MRVRIYLPSSIRQLSNDKLPIEKCLTGWWLQHPDLGERDAVAFLVGVIPLQPSNDARPCLDKPSIKLTGPNAGAHTLGRLIATDDSHDEGGPMCRELRGDSLCLLLKCPSKDGCFPTFKFLGRLAKLAESIEFVELQMSFTGNRPLQPVFSALPMARNHLGPVCRDRGDDTAKLRVHRRCCDRCLHFSVDSAFGCFGVARTNWLDHVALRAALVALVVASGLAAGIANLPDILPRWATWILGYAVTYSSLVAHIRDRFSEIGCWAALVYQTLSSRRQFTRLQARCTLVHSLLYVLVDGVLGVVTLLIITFFSTARIRTVGSLAQVHHLLYADWLKSIMTWLMGDPADLKLNAEFTSFVGRLYIYMFQSWDHSVRSLVQSAFAEFESVALIPSGQWESLTWNGCLASPLNLFVIICCGCFLSMFGASAVFACCADVLRIASSPLFIAHMSIARCWKMSISSLCTLLLLFRGRKHNALRSRTDHHNFDIEQLLMGVVLISIVVFLLPSVFAFQACIVSMWATVVAAHVAIMCAGAVCNRCSLALVLLNVSGIDELVSCRYLRPGLLNHRRDWLRNSQLELKMNLVRTTLDPLSTSNWRLDGSVVCTCWLFRRLVLGEIVPLPTKEMMFEGSASHSDRIEKLVRYSWVVWAKTLKHLLSSSEAPS